MKSKFFIRIILFSVISILALSLGAYGQAYSTAEFEFRIEFGQLADSTNLQGDSIYYTFKAKYRNLPETGTWSLFLHPAPGRTRIDSLSAALFIGYGLTTGSTLGPGDAYAELDTATVAMALDEHVPADPSVWYLYATHTGFGSTERDSVIAESEGIYIRHQPVVDSTTITPVAGSYPIGGDTTLNSGSYETPVPTSLDIKFFPVDYDETDIEVRIFLNESELLTNADLTFIGATPPDWDSIATLGNSFLIGTKTLNDTVLYFDMEPLLPSYITKGSYYVYVAVNDNKHANVFHSNSLVHIKHSPKIQLSHPAVIGPAGIFDVDTIDSRDQQMITVSWAGYGKEGDIDVDDNATIAIFLDTAKSEHGDLSIGAKADSFFAVGSRTNTAIQLTDGFEISENGDYENDMYVIDLTEVSPSIIDRTSNSYWRVFALISDGVDTTVAASPGSLFFKHSPSFKFLQDFGGEEQISKSSQASALGKDQVKIKYGDIFRINFEAFDLDSVDSDTGQFVRLVAAKSSDYDTAYFKAFTFADEGTPDAWVINSKHGLASQDSIDSSLCTALSYYDWNTGNMDGITDGDYYIYAFVSTTGSPDTLTFADLWPQDSTATFLASGTVKLTGTDDALTTSNIKIVPNVISLTEGDTITLDIKVNSANAIQGVFISFDLPYDLFDVIDQKASYGGIQPYIFATDCFFGTDTLTGTGSVESDAENWKFDLGKIRITAENTKNSASVTVDSIVAQIQVVSKGTQMVNSEETEIEFLMEGTRKTRFTDESGDKPTVNYSPAIMVRTAPMARITGNVPLQGRGSSFSKEITFELREIGSYLPISNAAFETLNDQNTGKSGVQITTDSDGKYELKGVPSGKYNLVAKTPNYLSGQYFNVDVVPGDYLVGINPTSDSLHSDPDLNEYDFKELRGGDVSSGDSTAYGDNAVDSDDYSFVKTYYTFDTTATGYGQMGDINGNGEIDLPDLMMVMGNINQVGVLPLFKVPGRDNSNATLEILDVPELVFKDVEFDACVWIENVADLKAYQFTVKYDPDKYELITLDRDIMEGDFLVSGDPDNNKTAFFTVDDRKGKVYVGCLYGQAKTAEGNGNLVNLRFKSKVNGETPDIQLADILLGNSNNELTKLANVANMPDEFKLSQNYPNPFNPETNIRFQLPEASKVTLKIYNILGQEIKTIINKNLGAGYHSMKWDGTNNIGLKVSSGVYIYRIKAGSFTAAKKMVFLK